MDNSRVAAVFEELADRLELLGDSPFKVRAYRAFAAGIRVLVEPIEDIAARDELIEMPGVGKAITKKVESLVATGTFPALEKARAETPSGLLEVLKIPGFGPKLVRVVWQEAGVTNLPELLRACEEDRLAKLPSIGQKKQARILSAVKILLEGGGGVLLALALDGARIMITALEEAGAKRVAVVGEARRGLEIVHELVLIVDGLTVSQIAKCLKKSDDELLLEGLVESAGEVAVTLQARGRARLYPVAHAAWVTELLTRTGDAAHLSWLEDRAEKKGGLRKVAQGARSEKEVYEALDLPFIPPELREGPCPLVPADLVDEGAVRGVFHVHTDWSDGVATIVVMAQAAAKAGNTYVGISDHSQAASYANGLTALRLKEQALAMVAARKEVPEITILHGVEVDILADGTLDLPDECLESLDFVIASVHTKFNMSMPDMTARIIRAISHPLVTILGHPTGRLLLGRKGYVFDLEKVAKAAVANDAYLEINANPHRLDLAPPMVRKAAELGARFVINPDAHAARGFDDTRLGVTVARRAGVNRDLVLNTLDRDEIVSLLALRKKRAKKRLAGFHGSGLRSGSTN